MKYLLILLFNISLLNGSYLLDKNYPLCIEDYYYKGGSMFYLRSSDNTWYSTSEDHISRFVYSDYTFDSLSGNCIPSAIKIMGIDSSLFNFLLALCGLIFGAVFLFFTVDAFVKVGSKK